MKEVLINGVTYLPASALAKQLGYTSDYIGQLCRAKKVDAQLVGRSWYVNPISLTNVREKRYSRHIKAEVAGGAAHEVEINSDVVQVESPLAKTTVKMQSQSRQANFAKRIDWKPLRYEDDSDDLLPSLKKEIKPKNLKVDLADSSDIAIKTSTKSTILVPDELPSVILKGKVSVSSLEEAFDLTEELLAEDEIVMPDAPVEKTPVVSARRPDFGPKMPQSRSKEIILPPRRISTTKTDVPPVMVEGFNAIEWSLVTVNVVLFLVTGLVAFSESSLTATAMDFAQNFEFEITSMQALVGSFLN